MRQPDAQDGFTLLETIIAFLILSIAMGIAVSTTSSGTQAFRRAGDLQAASLMLAELSQSELAVISKATTRIGNTDGKDWSIVSHEVPLTGGKTALAVRISISPRGSEGPVFDYLTFAGGGPRP